MFHSFLRTCRNGFFLLSLSVLWISQAKALTVTAVAEIVGDYEYISLDITVSRVKANQVARTTLAEEELTNGYIDVFLTGDDNPPILRRTSSATDVSGYNNSFYWEAVSATINPDPSQVDEYTINYSLKVLANTSGTSVKTLKSIKEQTKEAVAVKVRFSPSSNGTTFDNYLDGASASGFAVRMMAKPSEAPTNFAAEGTYHGAKLTWTVKESVVYTDATTTRKPSQVMIMVFKESSPNVTLNARIADDSPDADATSTCTYVGGTDCISCDNDLAYVTSEQTTTTDGLIKVLKTSNTGSARISRLDQDEPVIVVMQYADATVPTQCLTVTPTDNITLTELQGDQSSLGDPRCFVVSAAYGSPLAREVGIFRWFRDTILKSFALGRSLVELYYNSSRPFAEWVSEAPWRQSLLRGLLWVPALGLHGIQRSFQDPWFAVYLGLSLLSILLFLAALWRLVIRKVRVS